VRSVIRGGHLVLMVTPANDDAAPREVSPLPPLRRVWPVTRWDTPSAKTAPVVLYQRGPLALDERATLEVLGDGRVTVTARLTVPRGRLGEALRALAREAGAEVEELAGRRELWTVTATVGPGEGVTLVRAERGDGAAIPWAYHAPVRWGLVVGGVPLLLIDGVREAWPRGVAEGAITGPEELRAAA